MVSGESLFLSSSDSLLLLRPLCLTVVERGGGWYGVDPGHGCASVVRARVYARRDAGQFHHGTSRRGAWEIMAHSSADGDTVLPRSHIFHAPRHSSSWNKRHNPAQSKMDHIFAPLLMIGALMGLAFSFAILAWLYRCIFDRRRTRLNAERQRYLPLHLRDTDAAMDDDGAEADDVEVGWDPEQALLVKQQRMVEKKEQTLQKKVDTARTTLAQYEDALLTARGKKSQLTSRLDSAREVSARELEILRDADKRGREMYGKEAWDVGTNGQPPLRTYIHIGFLVPLLLLA